MSKEEKWILIIWVVALALGFAGGWFVRGISFDSIPKIVFNI